MSFRVGIDLGTTYCAIAAINEQTNEPYIIKNSNGDLTTPSAIYFQSGNYKAGVEAKEEFENGDPNCAVFFKRFMGEKENGRDSICFIAEQGTPYERGYTAVELSAFLLQHLKTETEFAVGDKISEAVITCPAYFFSSERDCILRAAATAGMHVKELIEEPAAAAIAYGLRHWRVGARVLVYDLGGGTFDASIVEMTDSLSMSVVGTMGRKFLGGKDFDEVLFQLILKTLANNADIDISFITNDERAIIRSSIEGAKKKLSSMQFARISEFVNSKKVVAEITREAFEQASKDLLQDTKNLIDQLLAKTEITQDGITDVLLVGGSTHMPQVKSFLEHKFGKPPLTHANPDTAVAIGAAVRTLRGYDISIPISTKRASSNIPRSHTVPQSERKIEVGNIGLIKLNKTATHAMGTIAVSSDGSAYINEVIVPSGEHIPTKCTKTLRFATKEDGSSVVDIYLLQGSEQRPLANKIQARYIASGLWHNQNGRTYIRIQYEYDNFGIINVRVRQEQSNVDLPIQKYEVPDDMRWTDGVPMRETTDIAASGRTDPLSIMLFFDTSYSMEGRPIRDAQDAAANKFVNKLLENQTNVSIGIGVVADNCKIIVPPTSDLTACLNGIAQVNGIVDDGTVGFGNAGHPFDDIISTLKLCSGDKMAFVLADGVWENQDVAVKAAKRCNEHGIDTVGLGFGSADKAFLQEITSIKDFDVDTYVESSNELGELFGNLAQSLGGDKSSFPNAEPWD